jgi:hypothetical protein
MAQVNNTQSNFDFGDKLKKILRLSKNLSVDTKKLSKAEKKMTKYSQEKITQIIRKYQKKPEKLEQKITKIIDQVMGAAIEWQKEIAKIYNESHEIVVELQREEFDDMKKLETILTQWINSRSQSIFTKGIIHDLEIGFHHFEHTMRKILGREMKNDKRIMQNKKPRTGFFTSIKSESALAKHIRKLDKRTIKEDKKLEKIFQELKQQTQQGIKLNFPYLFLKLLNQEGILETIIGKIENDLKQMLRDLNERVHKVLEEFLPIMRLFRTYSAFNKHKDEIIKVYNENKEQVNRAHKFAYEDYKDEIVEYNEIKKEEGIFKYLIARLEKIEEQNKH